MNIFHECRSEEGKGEMVEYKPTQHRIPYRPGIHEMFDKSPADLVKPAFIKYWQPLYCNFCGSTVFELMNSS